jgi:flagellar basal body-associated protein FliL
MELTDSFGNKIPLNEQLASKKGAGWAQFILAVLVVFLIGLSFILYAYTVKSPKPHAQGESVNQTPELMAWKDELEHFVVLEIGIAFITGCVVALTVELFMRNRAQREHEVHRQEISESIFFALFRTAITNDLITEMYKALLVPKFMRENLEVKYNFIPLPGQEEVSLDDKKRLILKQTISFKARNITDQRVTYTIRPQDEVVIKHDGYTVPFKELLMEVENPNSYYPIEDNKVHLSGSSLATKITTNGMSSILEVQKVRVDPKQCVQVLLVTEKVCRYADMEAWVTAHAAKDLKLIVELSDKQFSNLEFCAHQTHRQPLVPVPSSATEAPTSYTWRLDYPILPYQGVMLRWRPK